MNNMVLLSEYPSQLQVMLYDALTPDYLSRKLCHDKQASDGMQISAYFPMVSLLLYVNWQILQIKLKYTPDKFLIKKMNVEGSM